MKNDKQWSFSAQNTMKQPLRAHNYIEMTSHRLNFQIQNPKIARIGEDPMPSSKNYKRNYKQERATAKKRGETGVGSSSGDATRHRARRKIAKTSGFSKIRGKDVDHRTSIKSGGSNSRSNLRIRSKSANRAAGGRVGSKAGKASGGRKSK